MTDYDKKQAFSVKKQAFYVSESGNSGRIRRCARTDGRKWQKRRAAHTLTL